METEKSDKVEVKEAINLDTEGAKYDTGKQVWYPMPLVILKPLADVFVAGERKYEVFNCLKPFNNPDRRFWNATMRHLEACQLDPLAIDIEIKNKYNLDVFSAAQVAFNILLRLYHCSVEKNIKNENM